MMTSVASLNSYTCITCHVAFKLVDQQRQHYKTDWHRYNLKRKVAELPHVTAEEFQRKVQNQQNSQELSTQDKHVYCQVCRKSFGNQNAYDNHLNSKKHKENEINYVELENSQNDPNNCEIEEVDSDEWADDTENPIDNNDCLFCLHHSRNFIKNLEHMTIAHSFFIPDIEYCIDIQGFMCLWCNEKGRSFYSSDAARKHMIDKGHCKMLHEGVTLAEYVDYYDYSSSYPDVDNQVDKDEEVTIPELKSSDYQLVLPSGITLLTELWVGQKLNKKLLQKGLEMYIT
ncbi:zinc finger protein 622, partial [Asbolus verrucosus]